MKITKDELVLEFNEFLLDKVKEFIPYGDGVYLCEPEDDGDIAFRSPGATRGHIEMDGNTIKGFVYYETSFHKDYAVFKKDVIEGMKEFVGKELV